MTATLDVNVLVYAADESAERHSRARELLTHIATTPSIFYLFWPVLLGYARIVTHPAIVASPLSPAAAFADIDDLISRPHIVVAGEREHFWAAFGDLADAVPLHGNLIPDAHIVALMAENGVPTIWTADRDFRKFPGVTVKDPFHPRYADGFG